MRRLSFSRGFFVGWYWLLLLLDARFRLDGSSRAPILQADRRFPVGRGAIHLGFLVG